MATTFGMNRGGGRSLPPAPPTSWSEAYGGIPQVPDPNASAAAAITGNIGNLSSLYQLAGGVNTFNQNQMQSNLESSIPGLPGLNATSSANTGAALHGELPEDVIRQLLEQAAERGIITGSPGSDNSNAAYLRALGLNSWQMMQTGENMLSGAVARAPKAPLVNIPELFVTPDQTQDAQMAANLYQSAPVPSAAGGLTLGAARAGANAGQAAAGAWGPPNSAASRGGAPSFGTGAWGSTPMSSPNYYVGPEMVGHATGPFPPTQQEIYSNWQNWAGGIPTGGGGHGDWVADPASGGYWNAVTGEFSETVPENIGSSFYGSKEGYAELFGEG